jgi:23S rRNA (adenine2030-N6)-methyltransferase
VLKHAVLVQMLAYLTAKETPLWVVDTHAGAGAYSLESKFARKLGEFRDGIGRLWERSDLPPALADYLAQVR